jgi:phosphoglycerate dehydrogenase-like enzyme
MDQSTLLQVFLKAMVSLLLAHGCTAVLFSKEPLPKDHPFWSLDNVIVTPHISFTSIQNLDRMFQALYNNLQLYLQNERLINQFK